MLFGIENLTWSVNDLDIYVPFGAKRSLVNFFKAIGFTGSLVHCSRPYGGGSIHSIESFQCSHCKLDVVESRTHSPLSPILEFHSTTLMNYVSVDSIFLAYLSFTGQKRLIVNPGHFTHGKLKKPTLYTLCKYRDHGFLFQSLIQACLQDLRSSFRGHECASAITCSETCRTSDDGGCLRADIFVLGREEDEVVNDPATIHKVSWRLGGDCCSLRLGYDNPYVQLA